MGLVRVAIRRDLRMRLKSESEGKRIFFFKWMIFYQILKKYLLLKIIISRFYKSYDLEELAIFGFGNLMAILWNLIINF